MRKIYICHEFVEKSHFEALYKCANEYGYEVAGYFPLTQRVVHICGRKIVRERKICEAVVFFFKWVMDHIRLACLHNSILIVGIAPYNTLMNRYKAIFRRNKSIYFTSYVYWHDEVNESEKCFSYENKSTFVDAIASCFARVACVSETTEKGIKRYNPNTAVVNHSIEVDKYRKKIFSKKTNRILFLGRFCDEKNIPLIISWIKNNSASKVDFDFAGNGKYLDEIIELEKTNSNVSYIGVLTKDEIKMHLCEYDFLLLPSQHEPFGIVLLEALAAGVPCLTSNAAGPQEIITDSYNGFVFDVYHNRESNFEEMMDRALALSDEEYKIMSDKAIESSYKYDVNAIVKKWVDLFATLM